MAIHRRKAIIFLLMACLSKACFGDHEILFQDNNWLVNEAPEKVDASQTDALVGTLNQGRSGATLLKHWNEVGQYGLELGEIYQHYKDYDKALAEYNAALELFHHLKDDREGLTLSHLGRLAYEMRDSAAALDYDQRAHDYNHAASRRYEISEDDNLVDMAVVYADLGDYARALQLLTQALAGYQEHQADREGKGLAYKRMGMIYRDLAEPQEAFRYLMRALEMADESDNPNVRRDVVAEIGLTALDAGDAEFATRVYRNALEHAREQPGDDKNIQRRLADLYLRTGRPDLAKPLLENGAWPFAWGQFYLTTGDAPKAKAQFEASLEQGGAALNTRERVAHFIGLGMACEKMRDYASAEKWYRQASDGVESLRLMIPASHSARFLSTAVMGFPLIECYQGLMRVAKFTAGGDREALLYAEAARARLFTEGLAHRQALSAAALPLEFSNKEDLLQRQLGTLLTQREFLGAFGNKALLARVEGRIEAAKRERVEFVQEIRRRFPVYAAVHYPLPLPVENLVLAPDEVLLEYAVTASSVRLFVVKSGRLAAAMDLACTAADLRAAVLRYHEFFDTIKDPGHPPAFDPKPAQRLYEWLLKPAFEAADRDGQPLVPVSDRIIVVPDGVLQILPFEGLVMGPARSGKGSRFVGDAYDIAYAQSATALVNQRALASVRHPAEGLFILADPIFGLSDKRVDQPHLTQLAKNVSGVYDQAVAQEIAKRLHPPADAPDDENRRLLATGWLASSLSDGAFAGERVTSLTGWSASEEELGKHDLSQYRYLVFATHGMLEDDVPYILEPALVLNQVGNGPTMNGFLTMSKVMQMHFNAEIVILNACETGLGRSLAGEGVMAMGRAFQVAGAGSVLESLWSVSSGPSALLVDRFFLHLKSGRSRRTALRMARADLRSAGRDHPFFWAPFILIGD